MVHLLKTKMMKMEDLKSSPFMIFRNWRRYTIFKLLSRKSLVALLQDFSMLAMATSILETTWSKSGMTLSILTRKCNSLRMKFSMTTMGSLISMTIRKSNLKHRWIHTKVIVLLISFQIKLNLRPNCSCSCHIHTKEEFTYTGKSPILSTSIPPSKPYSPKSKTMMSKLSNKDNLRPTLFSPKWIKTKNTTF